MLGARILGVALRAQARAQDEAMREVKLWRASVERLGEAEKASEHEAAIPSSLRSGYLTIDKDILKASFFEANRIRLLAESSKREVVGGGAREFREELIRRENLTKIARAQLDAAWQFREQSLQAAMERRDAADRAAREQMMAGLPSPEVMQRGCGWVAGLGCLGGAGYMSMVVLVAGFGPDTTAGRVGLAFLAIPVVIAVFVQLAFGMKRLALEGDLYKVLNDSQQSYLDECDRIEASYNNKLPALRDAVEKAEAQQKKAEQGVIALQGKPAA